MTEIEYRKLLIDSVRAGDYPEKDGLLELLNICSLRFEKEDIGDMLSSMYGKLRVYVLHISQARHARRKLQRF